MLEEVVERKRTVKKWEKDHQWTRMITNLVGDWNRLWHIGDWHSKDLGRQVFEFQTWQ